MREFESPRTVSVPDEANMADQLYANADDAPDRTSVLRHINGEWRPQSRRDFATAVEEVARGFIGAGLEPGERLAIMSRTRYEWTLLDYAAWSAGLVVVPIYETSSAEQVAWICTDAGISAIVVESTAQRDVVDDRRGELPGLRHAWTIDDGAVDALVEVGADVPAEAVLARRTAVNADDPATIIYTSGTTARSKGCELTHRNLLSEMYAVVMALGPVFRPDQSILLFIPTAHVLGRVVQCAAIHGGVAIGHTPDVTTLVDDLREFRPTFLLAHPRVLEKVYHGARQRAYSESKVKGRIFDAAEATAVAYSEALERGRVAVPLILRHRVFDLLVFSKLRAALGGRCAATICGGAPLGTRLGHFFRGVGIRVFEGWGLTETTAAATVNTYDAARYGTVGQPVPGTTIRIADDNEVLLRGGIVFDRYWNDAAATAEAVIDGWFHTGDLGSLDDEGFLTITGRKKEILVTAGGKNVSPAVLEDRLNSHPLISQCMVVGDRKPFIGALITLESEAVAQWLSMNGSPSDLPLTEAADHPKLLAELQQAVDKANEAVSRAESIRKFRVLPVEFTVESGELTPSLKLKRRVVVERYGAEIEAIYA